MAQATSEPPEQVETQPLHDDQDWLDRAFHFLRKRPFLWVPLLIVVLVGGGALIQKFDSAQPIDTDPSVAGRPLSNPDQHLHALAVDPQHPGIIYLGSHYGLFTSTNDGKTWPQPRGTLNTLMILSIGVNPLTTSSIALNGVAPSGGDFGQNGLYVTHNGGTSWTHMHDPPGLPAEPNRYLIAPGTAGPRSWLVIYVGNGLYMTDDDGQHWQLLHAPTSDKESQQALWVSPAHPHEILLGSNLGLQISTDDGTHWSAVGGIDDGIHAVEGTAADPNVVYATTDSGVYRSQDGGATFEKMSGLVSTAPFSRLAMSQQHANVLYGLVGEQVWASADGGATWTQQSQLQTSFPQALLVAPDDDQHLYAGFYLPAAAVESFDGGKDWHLIAS
jgi:photosystem II stability/assembly factor-like uncharacterized protein